MSLRSPFEHAFGRGAAMIAVRAGGAALAFVCALILTRALGVEAYGHYGVIVGIITILNVPFIALGNIIMREVSKGRASQTWQRVRGITQRAHQALLITAIVLAFGVLLAGSLRFNVVIVGIAASVVVFDAASCLRAAQLRGLARPLMAQAPELLVRSGVIAMIAGYLLLVAGASISLQDALIILLCASVAGASAGWLALALRAPGSLAAPIFDDKAWKSSALSLFGSSLALVGGAYVDTFVLALRSTAEDVGIYRAAYQLALVSALAYTSLNYVLAPQLAFEATRKTPQDLSRMSARQALVATALALPAPLLLLALGPDLVGAALGADFTAAYWPLMILLLGQVLNAAAGFGASLLLALHLERYIVLAATLGAAVSGAMTFLLAPNLGAIGAAIASSTALTITNAAVLWVLMRRKHANPTILHWLLPTHATSERADN